MTLQGKTALVTGAAGSIGGMFLASPLAGFITSEVIDLNGGAAF